MASFISVKMTLAWPHVKTVAAFLADDSKVGAIDTLIGVDDLLYVCKAIYYMLGVADRCMMTSSRDWMLALLL